MFGKLLKYEFKSTSKWYLLITLIALGLSVSTGVIGGSATNGFVDMETNSMQIITGTLGFSFLEESLVFILVTTILLSVVSIPTYTDVKVT